MVSIFMRLRYSLQTFIIFTRYLKHVSSFDVIILLSLTQYSTCLEQSRLGTIPISCLNLELKLLSVLTEEWQVHCSDLLTLDYIYKVFLHVPKPTKIRPVIFMCYKYTPCLKLPLAQLEKNGRNFSLRETGLDFISSNIKLNPSY